jgi:hypothetical protein
VYMLRAMLRACARMLRPPSKHHILHPSQKECHSTNFRTNY